jgi:hypothetical protein
MCRMTLVMRINTTVRSEDHSSFAYRSHLPLRQRLADHDAFAARSTSEHATSLGASHHLTGRLIVHQAQQLFQIYKNALSKSNESRTFFNTFHVEHSVFALRLRYQTQSLTYCRVLRNT